MNSAVNSSVRHLLRNKLFVTISVVGLALGFATALALMLAVATESGYDTWVEDSENIYRIHSERTLAGGNVTKLIRTPSTIAPLLNASSETHINGIEKTLRIWGGDRLIYLPDNASPTYKRIFFTDPGFFDIFNWPILEGNAENPLAQPNTLVISKKMAIQIFGTSKAAIGQTVRFCCAYGSFQPREHVITAVVDKTPGPTHLQFDFLASNPFPGGRGAPGWFDDWDQAVVYSYVKTTSDMDQEKLDNLLKDVTSRHNNLGNETTLKFKSLPLEDIHFYAGLYGEDTISRPGNVTLINSLIIVTIFVFVIAISNYVNLTTIRLLKRTKELSMRSIVGARPFHLASQIAGETALTALLALLIGMTILEFSLPWIGNLLGIQLELNLLSPVTAFGVLATFISVVIICSSYPVFLVTRSSLADLVRKNQSHSVSHNNLGRSIMVIGQFILCVSLVIATAIVLLQTRYGMSFEEGFNPDDILVVEGLGSLNFQQTEQLRDRVKKLTGAKNVARAQGTPGVNDALNTIDVKSNNQITIKTGINHIDDGYLETYRIQLVAGRGFDDDNFSGDQVYSDNTGWLGSVLLNEAAVTAFGFEHAEAALGQLIKSDINNTSYRVIGVVKNHHFRSVTVSRSPYIYTYQPAYWSLSVRHESIFREKLIDEIATIWSDIAPEHPFEYSFADETFANQYLEQRNQTTLLTISTLVTIFIACLGLYGLVSFITHNRSKELVIRKILGATAADVIKLLLWDFSKPILIAILIACPIVFYVMHQWLSGFVYRIDLSINHFLLPGLVIMILAWSAILVQILKATRKKAAEVLQE